MTLKAYSLAIVNQLLTKYSTPSSSRRGRQIVRDDAPDRLSAARYMMKHHIVQLPATTSRAIGQRNCHVCYNGKKNPRLVKKVTTWCPECKVALCLQCFIVYHSQLEF